MMSLNDPVNGRCQRYAYYVIDDDGFLRHIDAEEVDRQVLAIFLSSSKTTKRWPSNRC